MSWQNIRKMTKKNTPKLKTKHNYWNKAVTNLTNSPILPKRKKEKPKKLCTSLTSLTYKFYCKMLNKILQADSTNKFKE